MQSVGLVAPVAMRADEVRDMIIQDIILLTDAYTIHKNPVTLTVSYLKWPFQNWISAKSYLHPIILDQTL